MASTGLKAAFVFAVATLPFLTNLGALIESDDPYKFPDKTALHAQDAPDHTQRLLNPLWAPTAYLQGVDCLSEDYKVKSLDGGVQSFSEHIISDKKTQQAAEDTSLSYSVHLNQDGHAILLLKAMSLPLENDKHEKIGSGTVNDVFNRDQQITALDLLAQNLLDDPAIKTIESVGFAQGSEGVYHLAEKYKIMGTAISDTGTNYTSDHLGQYVVSLDIPGDIHFFQKTGEHKPATEIDLGEAITLDWSKALAPLQTSWVEQIQTLAFSFGEAEAPEGYKDQGIKLVTPTDVCENPTLKI
jgi:hypothetical protein